MTTSTLLLYIGLFLGFQVLLGFAFNMRRQSEGTKSSALVDKLQQPRPQSTAWNGLRAFRVARRVYEDTAQSQCSFYLEPTDGQALQPYKPGQFLTFRLQLPVDPGVAARSLTRCYSLSDSWLASHYRITVKRATAPVDPAGLPAGASSNYFHDHVHVGDTLHLHAPAGHFYLDAGAQTPVVLVAGGIGITPLMSMLRWCAEHQPQRPIKLYYGVRNSAEHAYKAALEDMARQQPQLRLLVVYSKPLPEDRETRDYQHRGHVDLALLKKTLPHGVHQFYICGPAAMLESLVPALVQWGVAPADVHFEAFGPSSVRLPGAAADEVANPLSATLDVHFTRSGRTLQWTGKHKNLMDFAEAHGIAVESGCRSGSCGSCLTQVTSGTVVYGHAPDFDLSPGQCLLCVGKPRSPLVIEA